MSVAKDPNDARIANVRINLALLEKMLFPDGTKILGVRDSRDQFRPDHVVFVVRSPELRECKEAEMIPDAISVAKMAPCGHGIPERLEQWT